jgi:hypothetical protein
MQNMANVMESVYSLRLGEIARCFLYYNRKQDVLYTYNAEDDEEPGKTQDVYIGELYSDYTEDDIHRMTEKAMRQQEYLEHLASEFPEENKDMRLPAKEVVLAIRYDRAIDDLDDISLPTDIEMISLGGNGLLIPLQETKKYLSEEDTVIFVSEIRSALYNRSVLSSIAKVTKLKNIYPQTTKYPVPTNIMGIMFLFGSGEDEDVVRLPGKMFCKL